MDERCGQCGSYQLYHAAPDLVVCSECDFICEVEPFDLSSLSPKVSRALFATELARRNKSPESYRELSQALIELWADRTRVVVCSVDDVDFQDVACFWPEPAATPRISPARFKIGEIQRIDPADFCDSRWVEIGSKPENAWRIELPRVTLVTSPEHFNAIDGRLQYSGPKPRPCRRRTPARSRPVMWNDVRRR